jgi:RHS repeat-associated protein
VARFTYSPGYIDAVAVQERDLNADSDFGDTNEVVYYQANTLFSVYALSDSSGSVIERYRCDAYGAATVLESDGSLDQDGLSDVGNPYLSTGRRLDPETGLMQYRNRYYGPALGRFVSRDPLSYADSLNLFGYAGGRTTAGRDPSGTSTVVEIGNPKLPHFFEPAPGRRAVITGTIWQVYDKKGHVTFQEGRAGLTWLGSSWRRTPAPRGGGACVTVGGDQPEPTGQWWVLLLASPVRAYRYVTGKPSARVDPMGLGVVHPGPGEPQLGSMQVCLEETGIAVKANYMDEGCTEINFIQYVRTDWLGSWSDLELDTGKGKDKGANPPFYLKHGCSGAESGRFGRMSRMSENPGNLAWAPQYSFLTCAVCAAGARASKGKVYGCVWWNVNPRSEWRRKLGADAFTDFDWGMLPTPDDWVNWFPPFCRRDEGIWAF